MAELSRLEEQVIEVIADKLGYDTTDFTLESDLRNELGMDSLDEVELCMKFEKLFDITLPDEEVEEVKTVEQYVKLIASKGVE